MFLVKNSRGETEYHSPLLSKAVSVAITLQRADGELRQVEVCPHSSHFATGEGPVSIVEQFKRAGIGLLDMVGMR